MKSKLIWPILCTVLTACSNQPVQKTDPAERTLDQRLEDSGSRIDQMLVKISRAGGLSSPVKATSKVEVKGDLITVIWQGPAPDVLKKIADAKGLKFAVMGRAIPIPIAIEAVNSPYLSVLENIGIQLGGRADVVLKADALEIHYRAQ